MKQKIVRGVMAAALALAMAAQVSAFETVLCPIDDSHSWFTGEVKIDELSSKLLKLYKCARGHSFWVAPPKR